MKIIKTLVIIIIIISIIGWLTFIISCNNLYYNDYCSVCEWNWAYCELLDYNDIGYGHDGVLKEIWIEANYGKKVNLEWLENYRIKYDINNVPSFNYINYSNSKPKEPNLKYIGVGYITNYNNSGAYSKTTIFFKGKNRTYDNCAWNPYPYNKSNLTFVFKHKNDANFNMFKERTLYDANIYSYLPDKVNASWNIYYEKLDVYYKNGGYKS